MRSLEQVASLRIDREKVNLKDKRGLQLLYMILEYILSDCCSEEVSNLFFKVCGKTYFEMNKQV